MKKSLTVLLVLLLLLTPSLAVSADEDTIIYTEGTLYYTVENESITITGCFGRDAEVTVPAIIAGVPVNTIAAGAFTKNTYIQKLNLPDTITYVREGAIDPRIRVIYNANTDHPQDTPTDLILSHLPQDPPESSAPTAPEEPTAPIEETAPVTSEASTGEETPVVGGDLDDNEDPSQAAPTAATNPAPTDATTPAPTAAPGTTEAPETVLATDPVESTEATSETQERDTDSHTHGNAGNVLLWAVPFGIVIAGIVAAVLAVFGKKK